MDQPEPQMPPTVLLDWWSDTNAWYAAFPVGEVEVSYCIQRSAPGDHCHYWRLTGPEYNADNKQFAELPNDIGPAFASERCAMVGADKHAFELLHLLAKPASGSPAYTEARDLLRALSDACRGALAST